MKISLRIQPSAQLLYDLEQSALWRCRLLSKLRSGSIHERTLSQPRRPYDSVRASVKRDRRGRVRCVDRPIFTRALKQRVHAQTHSQSDSGFRLLPVVVNSIVPKRRHWSDGATYTVTCASVLCLIPMFGGAANASLAANSWSAAKHLFICAKSYWRFSTSAARSPCWIGSAATVGAFRNLMVS